MKHFMVLTPKFKALLLNLASLCLGMLLITLLAGCTDKRADVTVSTITDYVVAAPVLGVVVDQNLQIIGIDAGGAAEKAGIKLGDKLKKVDGAEVISTGDAKQKVREKAKKEKTEDRKVSVLLSRSNQELTLEAALMPPSSRSGQPTITPVPSNQDYF